MKQKGGKASAVRLPTGVNSRPHLWRFAVDSFLQQPVAHCTTVTYDDDIIEAVGARVPNGHCSRSYRYIGHFRLQTTAYFTKRQFQIASNGLSTTSINLPQKPKKFYKDSTSRLRRKWGSSPESFRTISEKTIISIVRYGILLWRHRMGKLSFVVIIF